MSLENIDLNKGLSRRELRELFQAKIKDTVQSKVDVTSYTMQQLENMLGGVEHVGTLLQRVVGYLRENPHSRRTFLEVTAGSTALTLAGFVYGSFPQEAEAMGSVPTSKETREDVMNQRWDCNPILPIPPDGCYTGTNAQASLMRPDMEEVLIGRFTKQYGITPTFSVIGSGIFATYNEFFPKEFCETTINLGVVPVIRYITLPFEGYKPIIKGEFDKEIREFARQVAESKHPIVLIPFQFPNEPNREHYSWGNYSSSQYVETWIRMHDLFSKEGANTNTVWSLKLKAGRWRDFQFPDPFKYVPPERYFDIIGWAPNNHCKPEFGLYNQSFESLFDHYYEKAAKKFSKKPQFIWELASEQGPNQDEWYNDALTLIKNKYFRVKGVVLDESPYISGTWFGNTNPVPTSESIKKIRKHFTTPYFIGSILNKS